MDKNSSMDKERLSFTQKMAKDKMWFKTKVDSFDHRGDSYTYNNSISQDSQRIKTNYDLFNNILNARDLEYVCNPHGEEGLELNADMVNRDIISPKVKAVLGMEMKRPFSYKAVAVNAEATTRKEQEHFKKVKEYVNQVVMGPIRQQVEIEFQEQQKGKKLSEQEISQLKQQIEQEVQARTPDEVKKYMAREHQDPSEILAEQLLKYLTQKLDLKHKFNKCLKHGLISSIQGMYIGSLSDELIAKEINSLRLDCQKDPDVDFLEDSEWVTCEYSFTPSQIMEMFGKELTDKEIDKIYEYGKHYAARIDDQVFQQFEKSSDNYFAEQDNNTIRVLHCTWKSLRKIGFLTRQTEEDEEPIEILVDESYKMNKDVGDISLEWEWIPEAYEGWKIGFDIYAYLRPIPGQFKDIHNLRYCKLPYYGVIYDHDNSTPTSMVDRLKTYQNYYNISLYRAETLMASDQGKKVFMNVNTIPDSKDMSTPEWLNYLKNSPIVFFDPKEEGSGYQDANTIAKQVDFSLASDINKYIELAEYIRTQAGRAVGVTDAVEGQISAREAVSNTRQNLEQTSNILEPYFQLHSMFKRNVLQALIENARVLYSGKKEKLAFVTDDMSQALLEIDGDLLDNNTLGIFVQENSTAHETIETIKQLAHAAMQNQKIELSDVSSVLRQGGMLEAEETLRLAEDKRREQLESLEREKMQDAQKAREHMAQQEEAKRQHEKELVILKEEEKRKTELQKVALMGASFNPDADKDNDGQNDFVELARDDKKLGIEQSKIDIEKDKLSHQKEVDKEKLKIERSKNNKKSI